MITQLDCVGLRCTASGFWNMVLSGDSTLAPQKLVRSESRLMDVEANRPSVTNQIKWEVFSGWPYFSMAGLKRNEFHFGTHDFEILESALLLEPSMAGKPLRSSGDYRQKLLPLRPVWPGFAINTIFTARFAGRCLQLRERCAASGDCGAANVRRAGIRCAAPQEVTSVPNAAALLPLPPGEGRGEGEMKIR